MASDIHDIVRALEDRLTAIGTPQRAEQEKRYLKSDLAFLGASVWQIESAVKELARSHGELTHDEIVRLVHALWSTPVHEHRMAAVMFLERFADGLSAADLRLLERLLRESRTWALVDGLAGDVVGRLAAADAQRVEPVLDRWAADADFWIRRASLLAELRQIRAGRPLDAFLRRADAMLDEKEFFIRKAIGWVLREAGKRRPDEVTAWLAPRTHRASGVTMREAVKYLAEADAQRLMAAYRAKQPAA